MTVSVIDCYTVFCVL